MSFDHSDHSAPFPNHRSSTSTVRDADWKGSEESLDPRSFSEKPTAGPRRRFQLQAFLSKMVGWPAIVICGQLVLQIAAWSFFAAVEGREFIALSYTTAVWFKAHTHLVTVIFTILSTVLAACASFLFSWGIRQSITLHLHGEGLSPAAFISTIQISSRSLILHPENLKWSAISIVLVIITGLQTSGWSALLTPQVFEIETPLTGYEIDISSPLLQPLQSSGDLDFCVINSTNLPAFFVGQTESGYAAMKSSMGFPASFPLMDQTFNVSTVGILPLTLFDVDSTSWFSSDLNANITSIPTTITSLVEIPNGTLSASYSMVQQGFTTDVTCEFQDLTSSLILQSDTVKDWTNGSQLDQVTYVQLDSNNCGIVPGRFAVNETYAYTVGDPNYLLMIACGGVSDNFSLIFVGGGDAYSFLSSMVCTLAPKTTRVQVDYTREGINTAQLTEEATAVGVTAGLSAVTTIFNMQFYAQAINTNVVGDQLRSSILDIDPAFGDDTILSAMEEYIRGVAEYSGSVLRACLSQKNGTFVDGVPVDMSIASEGFFYSEYLGWTHVSATTFWVLIPGTIVAIATIWVVLVAVAHHAGDPEGEPFDPTNAMHLVSASAAGGLNNVFAADIKAGEGVNVVLETVDGRRPALKVRGV